MRGGRVSSLLQHTPAFPPRPLPAPPPPPFPTVAPTRVPTVHSLPPSLPPSLAGLRSSPPLLRGAAQRGGARGAGGVQGAHGLPIGDEEQRRLIRADVDEHVLREGNEIYS